MRISAIVPQKPLALAKSRLATVLAPSARATLSLAWLRRVCAALLAVPAVEAVTIMTPDPLVRSHASRWGVASCADPGPDLNTALDAAIGSLAAAGARGRDHGPTPRRPLAGRPLRLAQAGRSARGRRDQSAPPARPEAHGRGILVIAADLPWVQPSDISALVHAAGPDTLVLAPSRDGTGTNALLVPPGVHIRPAYGEGSRAAHRREARRLGLRLAEVVRPGLGFDVDRPEDLAAPALPMWIQRAWIER